MPVFNLVISARAVLVAFTAFSQSLKVSSSLDISSTVVSVLLKTVQFPPPLSLTTS